VTYREDEVGDDHPLEAMAGEGVERIPLRNLSPEATAEMICATLGMTDLPPLFVERVQQTTGGNAYFVQELIHLLTEDGGILGWVDGKWEVDESALEETRLPQSVFQVVGNRLDFLSPQTRQVLCLAAVAGPVFWDGLLEELTSVSGAPLQAELRELVSHGLFLERRDSAFSGAREYAFASPLVQEVGYESLPLAERRTRHRQVAAWLVAHGETQAGGRYGLIADHLVKAGQNKEAIPYLFQAGEQASAQFANAAAARHFGHALELAPQDDSGLRYALVLAREGVYEVQGDREAQARDLVALHELSEALDDGERDATARKIEVALRRARYAFSTSDYPGTIAAAQMVVDLARSVENPRQEAAGHVQWGRALWRQGEPDAAKSQFERALSLARDAQLRSVEADSLRSLGLVAFVGGDYTTARPHFGEALDIQRELGDRRGEGRLLIDLGIVCRRQGDYARARSYLEQALAIQRELGDLRSEGRALGNLGTAFVNLGDYGQARALYEQSLLVSRQVGDRSDEGFRLYNLGLLHHLVGDDQAARRFCQQALHIAEKVGERDVQGYALTGLGHVWMGLGDLEKASAAYSRAVALRREMDQLHLAMESLAGLAQVSLTSGLVDPAQSQVEEILSYLEGNSLDGTEEPARILLVCYSVLSANQDPRAEAVLNRAHRLIQRRASMISDEGMRRSFLGNVSAHREILRIVQEVGERAKEQAAPRPLREAASRPEGEKEAPVSDKQKTKAQLLEELGEARRRISELELLASELKRAEETLWEGEKRFRSIAETASDAIIIFDAYENIFFWNQAARDIFGYWGGETRGELLASILSPEFHELFRREMKNVISTGESDLVGRPVEAVGVRKDGSELPLELSLATWKTKEEVFFTVIARDITDRKQAEEALANAYAEVEQRVDERTAELRQSLEERERLQQEVIDAQKLALQELSTPIIPIVDRILVMPLIGTIDTRRARDIMRTLLAGIREHRAKVVILDVTGVPIVDSGVANHLNKTIQAARLKGARTIVTGISDEVAETIVDLGIDWTWVETLSDLQTGLLVALDSLGFKLMR
jgi:PAS domain S-box-containing protein